VDEALDFLDDAGVREEGLREVFETYKPNGQWEDSEWQLIMARRGLVTPKVIENEEGTGKWVIEGAKTRIFKNGRFVVSLTSVDLFDDDEYKELRETEMRGIPVQKIYDKFAAENQELERSKLNVGGRVKDYIQSKWDSSVVRRKDRARMTELQDKGRYERSEEEETELRNLEKKYREKREKEMGRIYMQNLKKENPNGVVIRRESSPSFLFKPGDRPRKQFEGWDAGEEILKEVPLGDCEILYLGTHGHKHAFRPSDYQRVSSTAWTRVKSVASAVGSAASAVGDLSERLVPGGGREAFVKGLKTYHEGGNVRDIAKAAGDGYVKAARRGKEEKKDEREDKQRRRQKEKDKDTFDEIGKFTNIGSHVASASEAAGLMSSGAASKFRVGLALAPLAPWVLKAGKAFASKVSSFWGLAF
jgi:hypothetical protein